MSYLQCPYCGQKALSVATRCPHCGRAFESRFWQQQGTPGSHRRVPRGVVVAAVLGALVILGLIRREVEANRSARPGPPGAVVIDTALPPPPPARVTTPARESVAPAVTPAAREPAPPVAVRRPPDTSRAAPVRVPVPAPAPAPPPTTGRTERRYATTWVNIRASRSGASAVVRVLKPGESVMVDSLRMGWYRAVVDGRTLGYVDQRLVGASPGPGQ